MVVEFHEDPEGYAQEVQDAIRSMCEYADRTNCNLVRVSVEVNGTPVALVFGSGSVAADVLAGVEVKPWNGEG